MPSEVINFTQERIESLPPAMKGFDTYRDKQEKGLILAVTKTGIKTFYLLRKIDGRAYRIKIARFPDLKVKEAREKAIEYKNQIAKGINPAEEKQKLSSELTFKELFDKYINEYAKHNTRSWTEDIAEMDRKAKSLYGCKLSSISKDVIQKLFNQATAKSGKAAANRFLDRLRAIFNKAIEWGWDCSNPTAGIKKHKSKSRDRYLTKEELPHFFDALNEEKNIKIRDYIWLSLLTGARRGNVLSIRWQDVSLQNETLYLPDTKNGESQVIPLVEAAVGILKRRFADKSSNSQWVFPSDTSATGHLQEPRKVWDRVRQGATIKIWQADKSLRPFVENVRKASGDGHSVQLIYQMIKKQAKEKGIVLPVGVMDVRLHDLRRSLGSWLCHSGASQYIIGKSLNHKSHKSTAVYARLSIDPVREAMNKAVDMMQGDRVLRGK